MPTNSSSERRMGSNAKIGKRRRHEFIRWFKDMHGAIYGEIAAATDPKSPTLSDIVSALHRRLQNGNREQRQIALQLIYEARNIRPERIIREGDEQERRVLSGLLKDVTETVVNCLDSSEPTECREALHTLHVLPYSELRGPIFSSVVACLESPDAAICREAVRTLSGFTGQGVKLVTVLAKTERTAF